MYRAHNPHSERVKRIPTPNCEGTTAPSANEPELNSTALLRFCSWNTHRATFVAAVEKKLTHSGTLLRRNETPARNRSPRADRSATAKAIARSHFREPGRPWLRLMLQRGPSAPGFWSFP